MAGSTVWKKRRLLARAAADAHVRTPFALGVLDDVANAEPAQRSRRPAR